MWADGYKNEREWRNAGKNGMDSLKEYAQNGIGGITPVISVIIPVYNVAPYLREALDSVVNQTYRSLEILVIDDGSTDGSGSICDEYKTDPRVTVIHQPNRGLSNARNTGLDAATGDFIAFLDSDDAWYPSFIEELFSAIADADIAVCQVIFRKTRGSLLAPGEKEPRTQPGTKAGTYGREDSLRMVVNGAISWSVWNKLYRAELWKTIRFPDGHNFEDLDTMYRIVDLCKTVTVIDLVLYYYRGRPGSITQTISWKNLDDRKKAMLRLEEYVRSHTPEIFSKKEVVKIRSGMLNVMIVSYTQINSGSSVQKEDLRNDIMITAQQIGVENCNIRSRAAFLIVKYCPWLLNGVYSVYRPIRMLVFRMTGK